MITLEEAKELSCGKVQVKMLEEIRPIIQQYLTILEEAGRVQPKSAEKTASYLGEYICANVRRVWIN